MVNVKGFSLKNYNLMYFDKNKSVWQKQTNKQLLVNWFSVCLRIEWLWFRIPLQSLDLQISQQF